MRNDTSLPLTVQQAHVDKIAEGVEARRFQINVPPKGWKPFGWADQNYGTEVRKKVRNRVKK